MNPVSGPWPAPGPGRESRDPFDPVRFCERALWQSSGLLDDAHRAASAPDRQVPGPHALGDRLRALEEVTGRLGALLVDTASGDEMGEGGDLRLLAASGGPYWTADAAGRACALVDQTAALLPAVQTLLASASGLLAQVAPAPLVQAREVDDRAQRIADVLALVRTA